MAHIEIPLECERHITVVHIGSLREEEADLIFLVLEQWKNIFEWEKPEVTLDKQLMFGRNKNVPVMTVRSKFVSQARQRCCDLLDLLKIKYSKDWAYEPHITNPPKGWRYESTIPLPIPPVLRLCYRSADGMKQSKEFKCQ